MSAVIAGFSLGFSLILAIGAQNAFVLRQGIRGEHVLAVVLTCALSDAVLIAAGVAGFGSLVKAVPWLEAGMRYGGAAFLLVYGFQRLKAAWIGGQTLDATGQGAGSLRVAMTTCLAMTWLNPHVYLDTVVLLGSVSARWPGQALMFAIGACTASFVFFFSLGFGARLLRPIFAKPKAWQVLEMIVGVTMWVIAGSLIWHQ
jgi:L-lysine exporter family protein LysE/ArgO